MIGIILLIGIVKKNAIMMIDFALEAERRRVKPPREAIYRGMPATLPPHHDDHHGGNARRRSSRPRHRPRERTSPATRHHHHRRPVRLAGDDSVHHTGRLPLLRSAEGLDSSNSCRNEASGAPSVFRSGWLIHQPLVVEYGQLLAQSSSDDNPLLYRQPRN